MVVTAVRMMLRDSRLMVAGDSVTSKATVLLPAHLDVDVPSVRDDGDRAFLIGSPDRSMLRAEPLQCVSGAGWP